MICLKVAGGDGWKETRVSKVDDDSDLMPHQLFIEKVGEGHQLHVARHGHRRLFTTVTDFAGGDGRR